MRQKSATPNSPSERLVKSIRRATRKQYSAEEKIRIVLDGLRGEGRKQAFDVTTEIGEWCPGAACNKCENSKTYSARAGNVNGPRN